jgi:Skp family chaperone for outer membrane proteins
MRTSLLAALLVPVLAVALLAQEKPAPKSKSLVLVLSVRKIMDESDEGREFVKKLREEMLAEKQRITEGRAKLQEKLKQLQEAKIEDRNPQFWEEFRATMEAGARLEMDEKILVAQKGDALARATQQLLLGAQQEARAVMKERGAEIVLLTKTGPFEVGSDRDFEQELVMRRVLCCDDALDITDEVIKRMNAWYKEHRNGQGTPERAGEAGGEAGDKGAKAAKGQ